MDYNALESSSSSSSSSRSHHSTVKRYRYAVATLIILLLSLVIIFIVVQLRSSSSPSSSSPSSPSAPQTFGIHSLSSTYWFTKHNGDPKMDFIGTVQFDGLGNFSAHDIINNHGVIQENRNNGLYSVDSTGVGTFSWTLGGQQFQSHIIGIRSTNGVFDQLYCSFQEPDTAGMIQGRMLYRMPTDSGSFSKSSLNGTYWIGKGAGDPTTDFEGLMSFDGVGAYWGIYTSQNSNGTIVQTPFQATYNVNSDGTGTFSWINGGGSRIVPLHSRGSEILQAYSTFTSPLAPDGSIQVRWLAKRNNILEPKNM